MQLPSLDNARPLHHPAHQHGSEESTGDEFHQSLERNRVGFVRLGEKLHTSSLASLVPGCSPVIFPMKSGSKEPRISIDGIRSFHLPYQWFIQAYP